MSLAEIQHFGEVGASSPAPVRSGTTVRAAVLESVRSARAPATVSLSEVREVAHNYPNKSGRLLAAAAIDNMMSTLKPVRPDAPVTGLKAFLANKKAEKLLEGVTGSQTIRINKEVRHRLKKRYKEEMDASELATAAFLGLVAIVDEVAAEMDSLIELSGERMKWLADLNDRTDEIDHPALQALPLLTQIGQDSKRREAVVEGDRLLRFIVLQAAEGV